MRNAFEAWAQRDGHIVRRREDKPDEYLVFETQRRWVIWQAALAHGKTAAAAPKSPAAKPAAKEVTAVSAQKSLQASPDEAAMRNRVLNEVLDAFSDLDDAAGIEGALRVIQSLKKKQKALAEDKAGS
jgi:ribosomal protein L15E